MKPINIVRSAAVVLVICVAVEFYAVRELLAALLIFTGFFATVGVAVLVLIAIDGAARKVLTLLESGFAYTKARTGECVQRYRDVVYAKPAPEIVIHRRLTHQR